MAWDHCHAVPDPQWPNKRCYIREHLARARASPNWFLGHAVATYRATTTVGTARRSDREVTHEQKLWQIREIHLTIINRLTKCCYVRDERERRANLT